MYVSQQRVRSHNLEAVAALVRRRACSRSEIGETLGLNKATVSSLVGDLVAKGLLENAGSHAGSGPGRPRTIVRTDSSTHVSLVVEILTDRVRLSSWTLAATPLEHRVLDTNPAALGPQPTLRHIGDTLSRWSRRLAAAGKKLTGVAVSVPGLVDPRTGTLVSSTPLSWRDVEVRATLLDRPSLRDVTVVVERVANLATVAEWRGAQHLDDLVCLHGGETGLGVGIVTGGRLLTGANGRAGGLLFADNVSARSGLRLVSPAPEDLGFVDLLGPVRHRGSTFTEESEALLTQLQHGDPVVDAALTRFSERLSPRVAALIELFDPAEVVFSGLLAPLAGRVIPRVHEVLGGCPTVPPFELVAGRVGPDASLVGAALRLADHTFASVISAAA